MDCDSPLPLAGTCRYSKSAWTDCNLETNTRSRILTLKKGDNHCQPTRMMEKKCKKRKAIQLHFKRDFYAISNIVCSFIYHPSGYLPYILKIYDNTNKLHEYVTESESFTFLFPFGNVFKSLNSLNKQNSLNESICGNLSNFVNPQSSKLLNLLNSINPLIPCVQLNSLSRQDLLCRHS